MEFRVGIIDFVFGSFNFGSVAEDLGGLQTNLERKAPLQRVFVLRFDHSAYRGIAARFARLTIGGFIFVKRNQFV